jgi:FkbM family methyltransferase
METVKLDDRLNIKVFEGDLYIGRSIKDGYGWDRWMIPILESIDHTDKVILDIGANIGACSLMFSYYAPVYAYEPFHIDVLRDNCNQDTVHKITPVGKALSDSVEHRQFYYHKENCGSGTFNKDPSACELVGEYTSCTLDSEGITEPVSLIKIDVQGDDLKVLKGAKALLERDHPVVFVECETVQSRLETVAYMYSVGYTVCRSCPENMLFFEKACSPSIEV